MSGKKLLVNWATCLSVVHKQAINVQYVLELKESKLKYQVVLNGADVPVLKDTLKELFHFTHFVQISITLMGRSRYYIR